MFGIFLIIYLAYRNSLLAKIKGQNPIVWVLLTIASYFMGYVIGGVVVLMILINDGLITLTDVSKNPQAMDGMAKQITQALGDKPIHLISMELFGIGGYLLIRFLLERMPDKVNKLPENNDVV